MILSLDSFDVNIRSRDQQFHKFRSKLHQSDRKTGINRFFGSQVGTDGAYASVVISPFVPTIRVATHEVQGHAIISWVWI